ncbi:MAG: J domain-containing protein [Rhodospirillales bacterium]
MERRKARKSKAEAAIPADGARLCEWPGCRGAEGQYRAPRGRDDLNNFYWFCLEHIRQYNASWNYYAGMSDDEVEADVRKDTVWHRPSWPMGGSSKRSFSPAAKFKDPFGFFDESGPGAAEADAAVKDWSAAETRALVVLDLRPPITKENVKARYKELVKRHHPDANGGDKRSEERFKQISQAYQLIMNGLTA